MMKKTIFLFLCLLSMGNIFSQKYQQATLFLKNNEKKVGYIKEMTFVHAYKFKKSLDKKPIKIYFKNVDSAYVMTEDSESSNIVEKKYLYKIIDSYYNPVELRVKGDINLFYRQVIKTSLGTPDGLGMPVYPSTSFLVDLYYVGIEGNDRLLYLNEGKHLSYKTYVKLVTKYFSDCKILIQATKNKGRYRKMSIEQLIHIYNKKC